jgi:hypothetical protein
MCSVISFCSFSRICFFAGAVLTSILIFVPGILLAQRWSVSTKVSNMGMNSMVYVESIQQSNELLNSMPDTVRGTGFLISDKGNVYLVTTLGNIRRKKFSAANSLGYSIYISASKDGRGAGRYLELSRKDQEIPEVVFLSDQLDLSIVYLNKHHQKVLNYLNKNQTKPIPLSLMLSSLTRQAVGDTLFNSVYTNFKNNNGQRRRMAGIGISFIKSFDQNAKTFSMENAFKDGGNGSAVFADGKVIGMMTHKLGKLSDGVVLKSTYIIAALRNLQQKKYLLKANTKY